MKIAFFGTGEFSTNILQGILTSGKIEISLVVSQPDKPVGRKKELLPTPVKILAVEKNIKVLQPEKLRKNTDFFQELKNENFDFLVVVAYGKIIPQEILDVPKYGCINIHGSILPLYRGASPIQESIKNGDTKTGLTIMYMSKGMDEGDILKTQEVNIEKDDTSIAIFKKFEVIGPNLLIETLQGIVDGKIKGKKQDDSLATYCSKISKEDGEVNFITNHGQNIYNKYKAYTPWPGIYTYFNGKKLNIEEAHFIQKGEILGEIGEVIRCNKKETGILCNDGFFILNKIKLEGKKSMDINSFINGNQDFLNYKF